MEYKETGRGLGVFMEESGDDPNLKQKLSEHLDVFAILPRKVRCVGGAQKGSGRSTGAGL